MKTKYKHPSNMIQQYTEICLRCGNNVYDTNECIAPPVQHKARFKSGDHVVITRPKEVGIDFRTGYYESKETYKEFAVVIGECKIHYNCYKTVSKAHYSFICSSCTSFERVKKDVSWEMFESNYTTGDKVLVEHPALDSTYNRYDLGDKKHPSWRFQRDGASPLTATLVFPLKDGNWYCKIPRILNHGPGNSYSLTSIEKVYNESEFLGQGRDVEPFEEKV